jgi:two-component sensor histidine kinase
MASIGMNAAVERVEEMADAICELSNTGETDSMPGGHTVQNITAYVEAVQRIAASFEMDSGKAFMDMSAEDIADVVRCWMS